MSLLDDIKRALRIDGDDHDAEINDLIEAARADLMLSGVAPEKAVDEADPLIKRAVVTYCRANFDWDHPHVERLHEAYRMLKAHLTLSTDYKAPEG